MKIPISDAMRWHDVTDLYTNCIQHGEKVYVTYVNGVIVGIKCESDTDVERIIKLTRAAERMFGPGVLVEFSNHYKWCQHASTDQ